MSCPVLVNYRMTTYMKAAIVELIENRRHMMSGNCRSRSDLIRSLIPFFSLPDVLCDPNDFIWRKGTPFDAMTGLTAPSSDGLLAEVFWGFPQL